MVGHNLQIDSSITTWYEPWPTRLILVLPPWFDKTSVSALLGQCPRSIRARAEHAGRCQARSHSTPHWAPFESRPGALSAAVQAGRGEKSKTVMVALQSDLDRSFPIKETYR